MEAAPEEGFDMASVPKDPREIFPQITEDYQDLYGEDLTGIILYGSAAGRDYRPGKSDINFMIVLTEAGIGGLDRALETVSRWRRRKVAVPLFLTEAYLEGSTDVFPVEYLGFQRRHILVYGKDVLQDLSFDPRWVRLQCERELKGKLLLLREGYLESAGKGKALRELIGASIQALAAVLEALLFLKGEPPPADRRETFQRTCRLFGLDGDLFDQLLDIREGRRKTDGEALRRIFQAYLGQVHRLSTEIDSLGDA